MLIDKDLTQRLNLLRNSPNFTFREIGDQGKMRVSSMEKIPRESGVFWISGKTTCHSGRDIVSAFRVDTDSGGDLLTVYWYISENWYQHDDSDTLSALGMSKGEVFPFDWKFAIPLEEDIFHGE